jgi:hypothetical protein
VQDVKAEHLFYTAQLGFQDVGTGGAIRMRLPENSGDEVELQATTPTTKQSIVFAVRNLGHLIPRSPLSARI